MAGLDEPVSSLSGGNAQKVVIGKWLMRDPQVLLLDDPTKGVDVGTKAEFYALLTRLSDEGKTILFYSSDDEELIGLCDRVLVLHDGMIRTELSGNTLTKENLIAASLGASAGRHPNETDPDGTLMATRHPALFALVLLVIVACDQLDPSAQYVRQGNAEQQHAGLPADHPHGCRAGDCHSGRRH